MIWANGWLSWAATVIAVYALLAAIYVVTCIVVTRMNRGLAAAKIQRTRQTSSELIRRDRRQSLISLGGIAAMFGTGQFAYAALGIGFAAPSSLLWAPLSFIGSMILFDTWFYWLHRLIHCKPLYKRVHQWHHMTLTPVVWSNNSDRLIDNLFLQSYWLIAHLLLPIAPWVLLAHKIYDQITGVVGHSGFEHGGRWCWPRSPLVGVTHHDQHHRYFRCNYATHFSVWDRLMGTLHPEHDSELKRNIVLTEAVKRGRPLPAE